MKIDHYTIPVLDHGFVRLEAHMGGDQAVLRAARVSYGANPEPDEARDRGLIKYLMAHSHTSPFEHAVFTFHAKMPLLVARQWIRHRMASYNEVSMRYTEAKDEFYVPQAWRAQAAGPKANKQGSVAADLPHAVLTARLEAANKDAMATYRAMVEAGVAREMARMVLPVGLYTEWYSTLNAHALMHFIRLRSDSHAQWEMRQYSHAMAALFMGVMPWTFAAMQDEMAKDVIAGKRDYGELGDYLSDALGVSA